MVNGKDPKVFTQWSKGLEPVETTRRNKSMQEQNGWRTGRTLHFTHERGSTSREFDTPTKRYWRSAGGVWQWRCNSCHTRLCFYWSGHVARL